MDRKDLHKKLQDFLTAHGVFSGKGTKHLYHDPPSNTQLEYPCILYSRSNMDSWKANNGKYITDTRWTVTIITKSEDDPLIKDFFTLFKYCDYDREYVADNLHHTVFDLHY